MAVAAGQQLLTEGDPTRVTGRRVVGYLVDGLVDLVVGLGLVSLFGADVDLAATAAVVRPGDDAQVGRLALVGVLYVAWWIGTRVVTLGLAGWTPGMLAVSVRAVRWDGSRIGLLRALLRSAVAGVAFYLFGLLYGVAGLICMSSTRAHRAPHDFVSATYVVDSVRDGRMIIEDIDGVYSGPPPVRREDAKKILAAQGVDDAFIPPQLKVKPGEPVFDKQLDTWVVYSEKRSSWMAFDKEQGGWTPLP